MIITLSLPDEVHSQYVEHNRANPGKAMEETLKRFAEFKPEDRTLFLTKAQRRRLEAVFQAPTDDMEKVIGRIEELVEIQADKVRIPLSPAQQKKLATEAQFYKKEYPTYARERLSQIIVEQMGC